MIRKLEIVCIVAALAVFVGVAWGQTRKTFRDYARLAQASGDDLLLLTDDPNGTPVTYSVGLDELLGGWAGSASITTLGTIATGTWTGTAVTDGYIADTITVGGSGSVANGAMDADLQTLATPTNWRAFYSNGSATIIELALGASGTYLYSNGASAAPTWATPAGSGDMTKAVYDVSDDGFVDGNDVVYGAGWNADVNAPSMNAVYDKIETMGGGAPIGAQYVVMALDGTLSAERVLTEGLALDLTDGGANGNATLAVDPTELLGNRTWGDGSTDTIVWTWNRATGADPTMTFNAGSIALPALTLTTPLTVEQGGTEAATFTDGAVLLGSGADAFTPLAVVTDGLIVIGDGAGDPTTLDVGSSTAITILGTIATGTWQGTAVDHERGGLEADVSAYSGILAVTGGATASVDQKSELEARMSDVADFAEADGDIYTGVHDFGGADSFEIVNAAAPTTNAAGEIALDTTIVDHQPLLQYYDGAENMTVIAIDTAQLPATDNEIVKYDAGTDKFVLEADASAGSTAWDDIADPDNNGLTTVTFDNAEVSLLTGDNDAAASFVTIQNTDADHTVGQLYLLDLDYSADDGDTEADYIKCQDSGGVVYTVQQDGVVVGSSFSDGTATLTGGAVTGLTTPLTVEQGGTEAATFTDGAVLLGSGADAFTPLAVVTDGLIVIGDGAGDPTTLDVGSSTGITILGTVATGTWQATAVDHERGGLEADVSAYSGILAVTGGATASVDQKSELEARMSDVADFAEADGDIYTGVHDFGGATTVEIPNAESSDATLGVLGQIHIRGDEDRLSAHLGAGGEIAGEATMSFLHQVSISFDPGAWYDTTTEVFLFTVKADKYPNGIIIDEWRVSCKLDPDVEMNMNLGYSDTDWDMAADPNLVDVLDTTAGLASEDTDANINAGSAVAGGKVMFLYFDADPEGTAVDLTFEMWFHSEED